VDLEQLLILIHIVGSIIWFGGGLILHLQTRRAAKSADKSAVPVFFEGIEWAGLRIFVPTTLIVLGTGIWLVHVGPYSHGEFWVWSSYVAFGISFLTGAGFLGPESGRILRLYRSEGAESSEAARRIGRILRVMDVDLLLILYIIVVMVLKPGA
jgi:uncharacterized membrane protein